MICTGRGVRLQASRRPQNKRPACVGEIQRLRDQAARCTRLSKATTDAVVAAALITLATESNAAASRLEDEWLATLINGEPR
jgi:hypothetical protein